MHCSPLMLFFGALFIISYQFGFVSSTKYVVGDKENWRPNVNYTAWEEKHRPFHVGDWIVFFYTKGEANVIGVNEQGYNKCDASNPITNYSKGRSYAFQLNETKRYYFICSYGYCNNGMKVSIKAEPLPISPSLGPSSSNVATSTTSSSEVFTFLVLMVILIVIF